MKLADLRALPMGAPLIANTAQFRYSDPCVTYAGTTVPTGHRQVTFARVERSDGSVASVLPRQLRAVPLEQPFVADHRDGLTGHTITIETADTATARHWIGIVPEWRQLIGRRAVVERQGGRLGKVVAIEGVEHADDVEAIADAAAYTYGARYVRAGGAS